VGDVWGNRFSYSLLRRYTVLGAICDWPHLHWRILEGSGAWALGRPCRGSLDNILRPWIVGAQEKEHPVLLGFAMLGGTYAFGPLGLILGPLAISLTGAVVHELHSLGPITQEISSGTTNDLAEQSPKPEVRLATSQAVQSLVEET
jgi:hypothetical protein